MKEVIKPPTGKLVDAGPRLHATLLAAVFSLLFGVQFILLAHGDVINNYPYISQDGFDWYTEGVYLAKFLKGASLPELQYLRPPLFVFVTAADFLAGGEGHVLAVVLSLSIFLTYYFSLRIIDSTGPEQRKYGWYAIPLVIGVTIYPVNYFKPYILSDGLAVAISLSSVFLLVKYHAEERIHLLVMSVAVTVLAGLTQTYALIPSLVTCIVGFLTSVRLNKRKSSRYFLAFISALILFVSLTLLWRWAIPHATTPMNFGYLKLSLNMLEFYFRTWSYYFLPLILFFTVYRKFTVVWTSSSLVMPSSALMVLLLVILCLCYQWPDPRFTYYLWPWLMILLLTAVRLGSSKGAHLMSTLMLLLVFAVPTTYWAPSWRAVYVWSVSDHWMGEYLDSVSIDRKLNTCIADCSGNNEFLIKSDSYVNSTIKIYNQIKGL